METNQNILAGKKNKADVQQMAVGALFIALTYVATAFINIPSPSAAGGLVHLGNIPLFIAAVLFGKKMGAIAGGLGMALFDVTSAYISWAPFTLIIVGLMGYITGLVTEKKKSAPYILLGMAAALIIKIGGYYAAEGIITGNWYSPAASIPGNIIQVGIAAVISLPMILTLKKVVRRV